MPNVSIAQAQEGSNALFYLSTSLRIDEDCPPDGDPDDVFVAFQGEVTPTNRKGFYHLTIEPVEAGGKSVVPSRDRFPLSARQLEQGNLEQLAKERFTEEVHRMLGQLTSSLY
ncbi:MAG: hypothetical protein BWY68_00585 [bacterium ADurb.Bin400]|nr:MAG: hypothetical protein BWY68_00585 [bacterium ADurb.Bin400]